jgi:hypothetical protein
MKEEFCPSCCVERPFYYHRTVKDGQVYWGAYRCYVCGREIKGEQRPWPDLDKKE